MLVPDIFFGIFTLVNLITIIWAFIYTRFYAKTPNNDIKSLGIRNHKRKRVFVAVFMAINIAIALDSLCIVMIAVEIVKCNFTSIDKILMFLSFISSFVAFGYNTSLFAGMNELIGYLEVLWNETNW